MLFTDTPAPLLTASPPADIPPSCCQLSPDRRFRLQRTRLFLLMLPAAFCRRSGGTGHAVLQHNSRL